MEVEGEEEEGCWVVEAARGGMWRRMIRWMMGITGEGEGRLAVVCDFILRLFGFLGFRGMSMICTLREHVWNTTTTTRMQPTVHTSYFTNRTSTQPLTETEEVFYRYLTPASRQPRFSVLVERIQRILLLFGPTDFFYPTGCISTFSTLSGSINRKATISLNPSYPATPELKCD